MQTSIALWKRWIPLKRPFITALRTVEVVEDLVLVLCVDGVYGYGSASPTPQITGDSSERILHSLEHDAIPFLRKGFDPTNPLGTITFNSFTANSASYMLETALFDIAARNKSVSLADFLGGRKKNELITDITISRGSPEMMATDAMAAVEAGFSILKLKVGGDVKLDRLRLQAIVDVIPSNVSLRIDANQAWDSKSAVSIIRGYETAGFPIDLIEQPVPANDIEGLKYVTEHIGFPVMADESMYDSTDALHLLKSGAVDIINIKLAKCGGLSEALRICDIVARYGSQCMLGCMMEGVFGLLAAIHLASAKEEISRIDLDCVSLYANLNGRYSVDFQGEKIMVGDGIGSGVIEPALESWNGKKLWELTI